MKTNLATFPKEILKEVLGIDWRGGDLTSTIVNAKIPEEIMKWKENFTKELRDLTKDPDCCSYDCSLIKEILGQ